jgi:universal stress protein A
MIMPVPDLKTVAMKNILCPVDFSASSDAALDHALELAHADSAAVHLLYVLPQFVTEDTAEMAQNDDPVIEVYKKDDAAVEAMLVSLEEDARRKHEGLAFSHALRRIGDPADVIVNEAKKIKADLIVMGAHGRKGLSRVMLGSVADEVLKNAECDVMVYKKYEKES